MSNPDRAETILGVPVSSNRWSCVRDISPKMAQRILVAQPRQRPVNRPNVAKIAADIQAGRFLRTHQGLAFDTAGNLIDGQHRLMACVETQIGIQVLCNFNEPPEMFDLYDRGAMRSIGTDLYLAGVLDNVSRLSSYVATARFIWAYDQGTNPTYSSTMRNWTAGDAKATIAAHPGMPAMVSLCEANRKVRLPLAPLAAILTLCEEANPQRAAIFMHQVLKGEGLAVGDPAMTLRESAQSAGNNAGKVRMDLSYRIVRAWNAFIDGRRVVRLYGAIAPGGGKARTMDAFPDIAGYRRPGVKKPPSVVSAGSRVVSIMPMAAAEVRS